MDSSHSQNINWHFNILPSATKHALDYLSRVQWLKQNGWYLAGGTALALQVGHRSSLDLDFFLPKANFLTGKLIKYLPKKFWKTDIIREGTIYGQLLKAKTSFIAYPFFKPSKPYRWYGKVRILDVEDIAVMKIIAISQRGRKRDFVDLYWYCLNGSTLENLLYRLHDQYPMISHNYHHILKSLEYFVDAEEDPMPKLFFKATWKEIKKFLRTEVKKIAKKLYM